jgi:hypothetical protein
MSSCQACQLKHPPSLQTHPRSEAARSLSKYIKPRVKNTLKQIRHQVTLLGSWMMSTYEALPRGKLLPRIGVFVPSTGLLDRYRHILAHSLPNFGRLRYLMHVSLYLVALFLKFQSPCRTSLGTPHLFISAKPKIVYEGYCYKLKQTHVSRATTKDEA